MGVTIFCLGGYNGEKILLEFREDIGFPNETSIDGGYDILCSLQIDAGVYHAVEDRYYSSTGALNKFLTELKEINNKLNGEAEYQVLYEDYLSFKVLMSTRGHASIIGRFRADFMLKNVLEFEIETDQTFFADTIQSLEIFLKRYQ